MTPAKGPLPAHFDARENAWIFSKFDDVLAALRSPQLVQTDSNFQSQHEGLLPNHAVLVTDFALRSVVAHRPVIESITARTLAELPSGGEYDLVADFLQPWSIAIFLHAIGARGASAARYRFIARYGPGNVCGSMSLVDRVRAKIAGRLLGRLYAAPEKGVEKSLFLGLTQTLPSFLANAWFRLIQYPQEAARFREEGRRADVAFEDLLRLGGHVHTLYRQAAAACLVGNTELAKGDHVVLRMDTANCDSTHLAEVDGRSAPHVSLGAGAHVCPGSSAVRMLGLMATTSIFRRWSSIELAGVIRWNRGGTLTAPVSLPVRVR
jgi:cytochrome P450